MSTLAIVLIVLFIIFIVIPILLFGILFGLAVFETESELKKEQRRLTSGFSFRSLAGDSQKYVTKNKDPDNLILSDDTSLKCDQYSFIQKTYTKNGLNIPNAIVWKGNDDYIISATRTNEDIVLLKPTTSDTTLTSWKFSNFKWCLRSNENLCIFNSNDKLTLEEKNNNNNFLWEIQPALTSTNCQN